MEEKDDIKVKVKLSSQYPINDDYVFTTRLRRINMDEEMKKDFNKGKGFLIKEPQAINKTLKSPDSIFSDKYMKTFQDKDAFADKTSCECGALQGLDFAGMTCPNCHTEVKYVGDDFKIYGWIRLQNSHIIHPNLYKVIKDYFGSTTLEEILTPDVDLNADGNRMTQYDRKIYKNKLKKKYRKASSADKTFAGIGMTEFEARFDEILQYYKKKNGNKKIEFYNDIIENRDLIFISSIPVFTTALRLFKVENKTFVFDTLNAIFNIMAKLAAKINQSNLSIYNTPKYRLGLLWDLQSKYTELYDIIQKNLAGKKGFIRLLVGGRCNFTTRVIITPEPELRSDEVSLPYYSVAKMMEMTIINILSTSYNISDAEAYMIWYKGLIKPNKIIEEIINNLIKNMNGIPVLINRNPTLNYGSILAMRCVRIHYTYTMGMPLQVLSGLNADFDGDQLTAVYIPNKEFWKYAMAVFNPRNAMMISRNDGKFNNGCNLMKDMLINANGIIQLSRDKYSQEEINTILALKDKYNK